MARHSICATTPREELELLRAFAKIRSAHSATAGAAAAEMLVTAHGGRTETAIRCGNRILRNWRRLTTSGRLCTTGACGGPASVIALTSAQEKGGKRLARKQALCELMHNYYR